MYSVCAWSHSLIINLVVAGPVILKFNAKIQFSNLIQVSIGLLVNQTDWLTANASFTFCTLEKAKRFVYKHLPLRLRLGMKHDRKKESICCFICIHCSCSLCTKVVTYRFFFVLWFIRTWKPLTCLTRIHDDLMFYPMEFELEVVISVCVFKFLHQELLEHLVPTCIIILSSYVVDLYHIAK